MLDHPGRTAAGALVGHRGGALPGGRVVPQIIHFSGEAAAGLTAAGATPRDTTRRQG